MLMWLFSPALTSTTAVLAAMAESGWECAADLRRQLALEAFQHTAAYDSAISRWMADQMDARQPLAGGGAAAADPSLRRKSPSESALVQPSPQGWGGAIQLQGKELSTNNLLDLEAALATVREFGYGPMVQRSCRAACGRGRQAHQPLRCGDRSLDACCTDAGPGCRSRQCLRRHRGHQWCGGSRRGP